jgi:hypothetical protein
VAKRVKGVSPDKSSLDLDLTDGRAAVLTVDLLKQTVTR